VAKVESPLTRARVEILQNGEFAWNGNLIAGYAALDTKFAELSRNDPRPAAEIIINSATYDQVAQVVALMQKHGIDSRIKGNARAT
jgi:biopolymer transport protein ExbD